MSKDTQIVVRMTKEQKDRLNALAGRDHRPLAQWVRMQLGVEATPRLTQPGDRIPDVGSH